MPSLSQSAPITEGRRRLFPRPSRWRHRPSPEQAAVPLPSGKNAPLPNAHMIETESPSSCARARALSACRPPWSGKPRSQESLAPQPMTAYGGMMGTVERHGSRAKFASKRANPSIDVDLRNLQLATCHCKPTNHDGSLQNKRRLGMLADEIPGLLYSFPGGHQIATNKSDSEQTDQRRNVVRVAAVWRVLRAKIDALGFGCRPSLSRPSASGRARL